MGFALVFPLQGIYAESFGASPLQATLLVSIYALCQLFSGPYLGALSDRLGRRPVLLFSQLGTLLGFLMMAQAQSLWLLYLARALDGATAGNLAVAQAYIADNTAPKERAKSFAVIGVAFGLGFTVGPAVSGQLVAYGLAAPFYFAAGMSCLSILATLLLLPDQPPTARPVVAGADSGPGGSRLPVRSWRLYLPYLRRPGLRTRLQQFLCYCLAFTTFTSGFALFAERRLRLHGVPFTPREIGFVLSYSGVLGIVLQARQ